MRFVDLFAGLGGFHRALAGLGHECVFVSEIDTELRDLYRRNFPEAKRIIHGDIRKCGHRVPKHDILCAGFPCQPFSKSGSQNGLRDKTDGTLFHEIIHVIRRCRPKHVILENVGNFERHDEGRTWRIVRESLERLGYDVRGTEHVGSGGHGLISPHHLGYPHTRERFFVVANLDRLPVDPFPAAERDRITRLKDIVQPKRELNPRIRTEVELNDERIRCINHWNALLKAIPEDLPIPSFPIWGDEIHARYPFDGLTPHGCTVPELLSFLGRDGALRTRTKASILRLLPSYARSRRASFPQWKVSFIRKNRHWLRRVSGYFPEDWVRELRRFPSSLRKLEWNCKGEPRDLWKYVLQFRPSGLRAKRYTSCPALVAMTTTQVPILGPERRYITRLEALRLQGFPDSHALPESREAAFRALGNAVHVDVARAIAESSLGTAVSRPVRNG